MARMREPWSLCIQKWLGGLGLGFPLTHLFPAKRGAGYFAIKRFDQNQTNRLHMHTPCGLLHSDHRIPALDYQDLLELTLHLTRDVRGVRKNV